MPKFINNPTFQAIVSAFWLAFLAILGVNLIGNFMMTGNLLPEKEHVEKFGFPIEVAEASAEASAGAGAEAKVDIIPLIAAAKPEEGAAVFRKCASCHNADPGGKNQTGPNLHDIVGATIGDHNGFAASDSLKAVGGTWTYEKLNAWLENPRALASKTIMSFAGLKKPADRAAVIKYLMSQTTNPPPLPAAAAAAPAPAAPAEAPKAH
jgi:cytochrome c